MRTPNAPDALLVPYLQAPDDPSSDAALSELIASHTEPILRRVVAARLAGLRDDVDDVCSEARIELLLHLRRVKDGRSPEPIADFRSYAASVAANACNRYFRRRQKLLTEAVTDDDAPVASDEVETAFDRRRYVARLWEEIRELPREQRVALLLHLRDRRGNSVLFLFPLCGVANFARIAAVLEMSEEELARLWNELPADDNSIAGLLGCARQRVINLRMSGRKRLANRVGRQ